MEKSRSCSRFLLIVFVWSCHIILVNSQFFENPFEDIKPKPELPGTKMKGKDFISIVNGESKHPSCNTHKTKNASVPNCVISITEFGSGNLVAGTTERDSGLLPPWIDIPLAKKGQKFYSKHFGAIFLSYLTTTMLFVMTPQISEIVLYSGNSDTVEKFSKRYTGTASQFALWSRNFFGENSNTKNILQSLSNVRRKHLVVVERVAAEMKKSGQKIGLEKKYEDYTIKYPKFWEGIDKDIRAAKILKEYSSWPESYSSTENKALPINQFVLGMSLWTLAGLAVGFSEAVLIHNPSDEDLIAFNHFYAVIGYGLGIDDKYNTALQPSLEEQKKFYRDILFHYFIPSLYNSTKYSKIMAEVMAESLLANLLPAAYKTQGADSETPVTITMDALMIRLLKDYVGIKADNLEAASSPETKAFTAFYEQTFKPASFLPGFHQTITRIGTAALTGAGVKTFGPEVYSNDNSISQRAFLPG